MSVLRRPDLDRHLTRAVEPGPSDGAELFADDTSTLLLVHYPGPHWDQAVQHRAEFLHADPSPLPLCGCAN